MHGPYSHRCETCPKSLFFGFVPMSIKPNRSFCWAHLHLANGIEMVMGWVTFPSSGFRAPYNMWSTQSKSGYLSKPCILNQPCGNVGVCHWRRHVQANLSMVIQDVHLWKETMVLDDLLILTMHRFMITYNLRAHRRWINTTIHVNDNIGVITLRCCCRRRRRCHPI